MTVRVSKPVFNLREKLSELDIPVGSHGTQLMKSANASESFDLVQAGRKNILINGDFRIAQRATTNDTAGAQSTYHTLDRWMTQIQAGTITESQQSLSSSDTGPWGEGFRKYMRILNQSNIGAGAAQYAEIDQRIEAQDLAQSGWDYTDSSSYITLSFWIRASVAQNYIVNMYANDGTNRHFPFEVPLNANTWTKVTKSIPGYSGITVSDDNGHGATISFIASYGTNYTSNSGYFNMWNTTGNGLNRWPDMDTKWSTTTNATFDITGVQLEVGSIATEFEHRPYGEELALCQRYYWKPFPGNNSTSYDQVMIAMKVADTDGGRAASTFFPVMMRAAPSVVFEDRAGDYGGTTGSSRVTCQHHNGTYAHGVTWSWATEPWGCDGPYHYPYGISGFTKGDVGNFQTNKLEFNAEL